MTEDEVREALRQKLRGRWSEYSAEMLQRPSTEIFELAAEIAAARFCYDELTENLTSYPAEYLEYLLRFEDPLAVVRDQWASRQEFDPSHEFKEMLAELQDDLTLERDYLLDTDCTPERSGPFLC